ncbi:MAG TPA: hypothetical protein VK666_16390 [Chryseolinea sp.]|nr:hypothetical protein [Chryseolinea sp.]
MKTKSLYIAALMIMAAAITVVGKDEPRSHGLAVVPVKGSEVFKVIYKGESTSKVKLNVYNEASQIVFSETMSSSDGFIRPLNFSGLQFGEYTIELTNSTGKQSEKVSYQPAKDNTNIHVAKLVSNDGKYLLSVANGATQTITVKIFDKASNLVHISSKAVSGDYAQLYSVKDFTGGVTFEISGETGNLKTVRF